jgi:hypothetical protein
LAALEPGDVLMMTRLDRLARSTRDLLNTLAAITAGNAGFRSLGDTWADTTTDVHRARRPGGVRAGPDAPGFNLPCPRSGQFIEGISDVLPPV